MSEPHSRRPISATRRFLERFCEPDPRFGPVPAWWWSGDKLDWPRMRWQMDQLRAMGLRNLVVINLAPSGTLFGSDADDPPFLSEPWWALFEKTCDHAREIGMSVWFYDQIGFSGANFQAELVAQNPALMGERLRVASAEGMGPLRVECPADAKPIGAYLVPLDAPAEPRPVPVAGRVAEATAGRPSRLSVVFSLRQGYDFFSRDACEALLNTVHRQFQKRLPQHFGSTIVGSFQDELPELPTWGPTFADTFAAEFGYRLEPVVHRLFEPGDDFASRQTRLHYHMHRARLAEQACFEPFYRWHAENGLTCGCDQQSPAREARALGCVNKYADYMLTHRWFAAPGSDVHGNSRLHGSIAFLHDRPRVWLEGFHSTGWGGTIADTVDWMLPHFQSGANLYNPHAVYYSTHNGWWEWAPPSTCWRQPYAMHYAPFADTVARLCRVLATGVQQATVGVLFPTATVQSAMGAIKHFDDATAADQALHEVIGSMRWHQSAPGPLDAAGVDFHILDEPAVASAEVGEAALNIRGVPLRAVVLPAVTMLHDATAAQLERFARAGGRVVSLRSERWTTDAGRTIDVRSLPGGAVVESAADLPAALAGLPRQVEAACPFLHRREGDLNLLFVPAVTGMATVVKWPGWFEPIEHSSVVPERYRDRAELSLPASAGDVARFDPVDGSVTPVPTTPDSAGRRRVSLDFGGAPFAVLAWTDGAAGESSHDVPPAESPSHAIPLGNEWTCDLLPTQPTEFPDTFDPADPARRLPHTAELQWRDGDGDFSAGLPADGDTRLVRAGFGARAWRHDADGRPAQPAVYSPRFGIATDPVHIHTLGPKAHVPEEFIDLGRVAAGAPVTIRAGVVSPGERTAVLAVAANAAKSAKIAGQTFAEQGKAYVWTTPPIQLRAGENPIEIALSADKDEPVRAFWCLLDPARAAEFARPERMVTPEAPVAGSRLAYRAALRLPAALAAGQVKVSVAATVAVFVDGEILGRHGGFDPYRPGLRGCAYALPKLAAGDHELSVELIDPGGRAPLVVDLRATLPDGRVVTLVSGLDGWTVSRDSGPAMPVALHRKPDAAGAAWHLWRRAHPLPGAAWIESHDALAAGSSVVLDLPLAPPLESPRPQWFQWSLPPGVTAMRLPLAEHRSATLWIDGVERPIGPGGAVRGLDDATTSRRAVLRVESRQHGGGVFEDAVTYTLGRGTIRTGSWLQQGLRSYSGALRLGQAFTLPTGVAEGRRTVLDLGRVRGTVEAFVNGRSAGVRFMPPYRFDLSGIVRAGENRLELVVTNTLANHLSTWSPTRWWSPDQLECGVFGPARLEVTGQTETAPHA